MPIFAYEEVETEELNKIRYTSDGKTYTLNHSEDLIVSMRYKGSGRSNANSQGWERNSSYYFKELQSNHPEYFSKKNLNRINKCESPFVDNKFCEYFPEYSNYKNEVLVHHHIGKDGQAVAVPASIHKGSGEIHMYENELGITDHAREFSEKCSIYNEKNDSKNITANEFHFILDIDKEEERMDRSLALTNDDYRQPTNEELMASGESAIDQHMEILRDEMRSEGMEDGSEMESIISARRDESMSELRNGIYGNENNTSFKEASDYDSSDNSENELDENSFGETSTFDYSDEMESELNENSLEEVCAFGSSDEMEGKFDDNAFEEASAFDSSEDLESNLDVNSFEDTNDFEYAEGMDSSIAEGMDSSLSDNVEQSR